MKNTLVITFILITLFIETSVIGRGPGKNSKMIVYEQDQECVIQGNSSFQASKGWKFDKVALRLVSPEEDVSVYFLELPFDVSMPVEDLIFRAWKLVDPSFSLKILQKVSPPPQSGWEQNYCFVFDVPAAELREVTARMSIFEGTAYIYLVDGSSDGLSRRGAQLNTAVNSWKPYSLKKEDLSTKSPKLFSVADEKSLDAFIEKTMEVLQIPGVAVGIIQNNKVVFRKGFGVTQIETKEPVTPETLFMIGSMTKPLTTLMMA